MKKALLSLSVLIAFLGLSASVCRADVFDFTLSGASDSGSGTITATEQGTSGIYDITAITGTLNGIAISSLLPVKTYPDSAQSGNDNLFYYPEVYISPNIVASNLDDNGTSFTLADGEEFNLWFGVISGCPKTLGNTNTYYLMDGPGPGPYDYTYDPVSFDLTAETAEPASLLLLGTGALGVFLLWHRRRAVKQI
jgi:hypothetical protein